MYVLGRSCHGQEGFTVEGIGGGPERREGKSYTNAQHLSACIYTGTNAPGDACSPVHLLFSSADSSFLHPVSPTPNHGMASRLGSLYKVHRHTNGNRSCHTASPYKTRAWRSDIETKSQLIGAFH